MFRLFLDHATRWLAVGLVAIFAVGGLPGIAAACEGGGLEIIATFAHEGEGPLTGTVKNPKDLEIEVEKVFKTAAGPILGGTCKAKLKIPSLGACTIIQDEPVGAGIDAVEL